MKALSLLALALGVSTLVSAPVEAAQSNWSDTMGARMRVIAGGMETGNLVAGIEIELEKNWKTYWRNPGGAGIPPQLDFSRSTNVKSVDVRWPAPKRYFDGYATSLVYNDHIVLPLRITPEDPSKAIKLTLDMRYGVCSEICVPAVGNAAMLVHPLAADDPAMADRIGAFEQKVPVSDQAASFRIEGITRVDGKLKIKARVPDGEGKTDLFSHSSAPLALPLTKQLKTSDAEKVVQFEQRLPKDFPDEPVTLSFVLVKGSKAVEQSYSISKDAIVDLN
ncbi:protein-disulfide reductase DsbD domain-containing protein [Coralliovum pocilloporae]|uniref:protein-disulfide reductase DsbD domain-containing protein n=1 Tax=Coralliovum pocilloporae TaxID=3066369 RepID=UPI003306F936